MPVDEDIVMTQKIDSCPRCSGLTEPGDKFCQDCGLLLAGFLSAPSGSAVIAARASETRDETALVPGATISKANVAIAISDEYAEGLSQPATAKPALVTITRSSPQRSSVLSQRKPVKPSNPIWWLAPVSVPEWMLVLAMAAYSATTVFFLQKSHPDWLNSSLGQLSVAARGMQSDVSAVMMSAAARHSQKPKASNSEGIGMAATANPTAEKHDSITGSVKNISRQTLLAAPATVRDRSAGHTISGTASPADRHLNGIRTNTTPHVAAIPAASGGSAVSTKINEAKDVPESGSSIKKAPSRQKVRDLARDLALYNKLLARYFSRGKEEVPATSLRSENAQGDVPPSGEQNTSAGQASSGSPASEPPSFEEWLNNNKQEF